MAVLAGRLPEGRHNTGGILCDWCLSQWPGGHAPGSKNEWVGVGFSNEAENLKNKHISILLKMYSLGTEGGM